MAIYLHILFRAILWVVRRSLFRLQMKLLSERLENTFHVRLEQVAFHFSSWQPLQTKRQHQESVYSLLVCTSTKS